MSEEARHDVAAPAVTVMLTFSAPADGAVEDDFNEWYDTVHVPEILAHVDGLARVSRYRLSSEQFPLAAPGAAPYLAVYEFDGEPGELLARMGAAPLTMSATLGQGELAPVTLLYERLG